MILIISILQLKFQYRSNVKYLINVEYSRRLLNILIQYSFILVSITNFIPSQSFKYQQINMALKNSLLVSFQYLKHLSYLRIEIQHEMYYFNCKNNIQVCIFGYISQKIFNFILTKNNKIRVIARVQSPSTKYQCTRLPMKGNLSYLLG